MKKDNLIAQRVARVWYTTDSCDLDDFKRAIDRNATLDEHPFACDIQQNVPIYDGAEVAKASATEDGRKAVMAEWADVMLNGSGIVVFKNTGMNMAALDRASEIFWSIIDEQHRTKSGVGDHFAKPGANDRVWNALEKLCLADPETFAHYYANPLIAMVSQCWLGTDYQLTSQLNVVNPGGEAQSVHRDYHMGFQTEAQISRFPAHAHMLSPVLTLQGAIAHVDMPIETGPTLYLPFSQSFAPGYFAWRRPEFKDFFNTNYVQLPLAKGDMAFFNPALFHAAGHNKTTNVKRMANLLQVGSVYGRSIESINRARMSKALYPVLKTGILNGDALDNVIAASAEGYSFPTNLDRDPPVKGLAPETQAAYMRRALSEGISVEEFNAHLDTLDWRKEA